MAYPAGYWAELVRSLSGSSLVENAAGASIWLRTSDGLPLEQEISIGNRWLPISGDEGEPDYVSTSVSSNPYRFQKAGEAWLPSADGIAFNTINWGGASTYRIYDSTGVVLPRMIIGNKRVAGIVIGGKRVAGAYIGGKRVF